jgi:lysophospholipase L1-like esterase
VRFRVYRRALSAVALPTLILVFAQTHPARLLWALAGESAGTRWAGFFIVLGLIGLECHYLACLAQFIRVRGDVAGYAAIDGDPAVVERRRQRRFRLVAAGLSILFALGLAEAGFRILGIHPPVDPPPSPFEREKFDKSLNALGIREDWDRIPEGDQRLRIAFLGDSFTYGLGVEQNQTFCHLVEGMLSDDWPTGVLTINLGMPGTAPGSQLERFGPMIDQFKPDVVVQVLYPNDLGVDLHFLLQNLHRMRDERLWVGDFSRVLAFSEKQIRYWLIWNQTLGYFRGGRTADEQAASWARLKADVRACKGRAESDGAVYCIVLFPWIYRLTDYPLRGVHEQMRAMADELSVPFLDLLKTYQAVDERSVRLGNYDDHPNPAGHRLAAERIALFLRKEILPDLPVDEP